MPSQMRRPSAGVVANGEPAMPFARLTSWKHLRFVAAMIGLYGSGYQHGAKGDGSGHAAATAAG